MGRFTLEKNTVKVYKNSEPRGCIMNRTSSMMLNQVKNYGMRLTPDRGQLFL